MEKQLDKERSLGKNWHHFILCKCLLFRKKTLFSGENSCHYFHGRGSRDEGWSRARRREGVNESGIVVFLPPLNSPDVFARPLTSLRRLNQRGKMKGGRWQLSNVSSLMQLIDFSMERRKEDRNDRGGKTGYFVRKKHIFLRRNKVRK